MEQKINKMIRDKLSRHKYRRGKKLFILEETPRLAGGILVLYQFSKVFNSQRVDIFW